jgi:hypothetical protein
VSVDGLTTHLALEHFLDGGGKVGLVDDGDSVRLEGGLVLIDPSDGLPLGHVDGAR